jgi:IS605 OrfB family transposase
VKVVNLLLDRIYSSNDRTRKLGEKLSKYRGKAYTLLRQERDLCYQHNDDIKKLIFERLNRNALEQAGRMVLADYTRKQLIIATLENLNGSEEDILKLMARKRIPPELIRIVRDSCEAVKNNGSGYHYALGVLRQVRYALDIYLLDFLNLKIGWRGRQRAKIRNLLKKGSKDQPSTLSLIKKQIHDWVNNGYPFANPQLRNYSLDFSASTENSIGQGYWFTLDKYKENEILLHLKLPPGIEGKYHNDSPYKSKTLTFRFFNWFPRASSKDRKKAKIAETNGDMHRAERLLFRAVKFEDMHQQLLNTIEFQHTSHRLSRLKQRKNPNIDEITKLEKKKEQLKDSRRNTPPRLFLKGNRVILQIPFLSPNGEVSSQILGKKKYQTFAGVDRGIRAPVALSVEKQGSFEDLLITVGHLVMKRERLKKRAYRLTSIVKRKKNNWDKKRSGLCNPAIVLKHDRHVSALWRKIRRLDREIARQVASQTVWFCEEHLVKKLFFEDLRSFQAHAGSKDLSWSLSTNLWGKIIDTVRYMRESLGHSPYSVWTVNPRYTSQTCHKCGKRGIRVEDETSTSEKKGGEYFYCAKCEEHFHADINAARNIIHVQDNKSSAVPGRTKGICPTLSKLQ